MSQTEPELPPAARSGFPRIFRNRSRLWWSLLLFALGVGLSVLLARELGAAEVRRALWDLAHLLPVLVLIEAARLLAELLSTRQVLRGTHVPFRLLLQAQCAATVCNNVMPAGRAAGEGIKAAILTPAVGGARAIGVGAAGQIMTLLVNGAYACVAAVVAWMHYSAPQEAAVFGVYGGVLLLVGVAVVASLRSILLDALLRRFRATAVLRDRVRELAASGSGFGVAALGLQALSRFGQVAQLALLLRALGQPLQLHSALFAQGVQLVGAAAGDLLPAHMGATEGAFTLAAEMLGLSAGAALSLAVVVHATQLIFSAIALLGAFVLRMVHPVVARVSRPTVESAMASEVHDAPESS